MKMKLVVDLVVAVRLVVVRDVVVVVAVRVASRRLPMFVFVMAICPGLGSVCSSRSPSTMLLALSPILKLIQSPPSRTSTRSLFHKSIMSDRRLGATAPSQC